MSGENEAPAEMPGVEEIQFVLAQPLKDDDWIVEKARAILDLFAPILAEKEREIEAVKQVCEMNATSGAFWAERGKNAEAALAAERAMLKRIVDLHADWRLCMPKDWEGDPLSDACEDAAAVIRAEGQR